MNINQATQKVLDECIQYGATLLDISYLDNLGIIEHSNGTLTTIIYNEELNEWE